MNLCELDISIMGSIIFNKADARTQSRDVLHERRKQVIQLHQGGVPVMRIVELSGLSWYAVNAAIKLYQEHGESALKPATRGRNQGIGRMLSEEQQAEIRQMLWMRRPWYFGLEEKLWDRTALMKLVAQKYGVKLSRRVTGNYLQRWGLTLKQPNKNPYERCDSETRGWLDVHYAAIVQKAREENAEIYWISRPLALDSNLWGCSNVAQEQPPEEHETNRAKQKFTMVSVVNNQGKVSWMINKGTFAFERQIIFLKALIKNTRKKVFLIRGESNVCNRLDSRYFMEQGVNRIEFFPREMT